ncbi:MAG: PDGLE domain-containing protein [Sulfolobales archaeon]
MISRRSLIILLILLLLSPLFGVYLASVIGYREPLDIVAEELGLREWESLEWTPLRDYTFPGLPDWAGYIVAGLIGVLVIISVGYLIKILARV